MQLRYNLHCFEDTKIRCIVRSIVISHALQAGVEMLVRSVREADKTSISLYSHICPLGRSPLIDRALT